LGPSLPKMTGCFSSSRGESGYLAPPIYSHSPCLAWLWPRPCGLTTPIKPVPGRTSEPENKTMEQLRHREGTGHRGLVTKELVVWGL
jgi:hypothetical protein